MIFLCGYNTSHWVAFYYLQNSTKIIKTQYLNEDAKIKPYPNIYLPFLHNSTSQSPPSGTTRGGERVHFCLNFWSWLRWNWSATPTAWLTSDLSLGLDLTVLILFRTIHVSKSCDKPSSESPGQMRSTGHTTRRTKHFGHDGEVSQQWPQIQPLLGQPPRKTKQTYEGFESSKMVNRKREWIETHMQKEGPASSVEMSLDRSTLCCI